MIQITTQSELNSNNTKYSNCHDQIETQTLAGRVFGGLSPASGNFNLQLAGLRGCAGRGDAFNGGSAKAANVLINPGAETGDTAGWTMDPDGSIANTNQYYYNGGADYPPTASNILAHTGEYCFKTYQTYANAATRIYQDYAAGPGSQWTANCYALSHSQDYISTPCNAHLQVVFYDNAYNALAVYGSVFLDPTDYSGLGVTWTVVPPMAVDATGWLYLAVTNNYLPTLPPKPITPD